jgi:hypothetical protein
MTTTCTACAMRNLVAVAGIDDDGLWQALNLPAGRPARVVGTSSLQPDNVCDDCWATRVCQCCLAVDPRPSPRVLTCNRCSVSLAVDVCRCVGLRRRREDQWCLCSCCADGRKCDGCGFPQRPVGTIWEEDQPIGKHGRYCPAE